VSLLIHDKVVKNMLSQDLSDRKSFKRKKEKNGKGGGNAFLASMRDHGKTWWGDLELLACRGLGGG
jgi:hypothetical protein